MNWKIKWALSAALSSIPFSSKVYDLAQKHCTGNWRRDMRQTMSGPNSYSMHLDVFEKYWGDIGQAKYYEFGVARDLFSNILNYCYGMDNQLAIDLNPLARPELINNISHQLSQIDHPKFVRSPPKEVGSDFERELLENYGIDYRAPLDARHVDLPDGSIDLIATTSTFEHIPKDVLFDILLECRRLCHAGSIMSVEIDYTDHYYHSDKGITPYNFLQFSSAQWEVFHMKHNFTNRLRHSDHRELITKAGFTILEEQTVTPPRAEEMLASVPLSIDYDKYDKNDLMITCGRFVAQKTQ